MPHGLVVLHATREQQPEAELGLRALGWIVAVLDDLLEQQPCLAVPAGGLAETRCLEIQLGLPVVVDRELVFPDELGGAAGFGEPAPLCEDLEGSAGAVLAAGAELVAELSDQGLVAGVDGVQQRGRQIAGGAGTAGGVAELPDLFVDFGGAQVLAGILGGPRRFRVPARGNQSVDFLRIDRHREKWYTAPPAFARLLSGFGSSKPMATRVIGVIGGTGVYEMDGLTDVEEVQVDTPFGAPSDRLVTGRLGDAKMVFLARHGRGHRILPHEINYRANVFAMKTQGVEWLISISAVGSMREEIRPGDMVIVDQFIDRTKGRPSTFFGEGLAAHVSFGDPVSPKLASVLVAAAEEALAGSDVKVHEGGTYMVMNGPQFSTRAESLLYRSWGISVIGMTNMPEAKLAREAEISYATIALATDYDCWHEVEDEVSVDNVVAVLKGNAQRAKKVLTHAIPKVPAEHDCIAANALEYAILTDKAAIPEETKKRLAPIVGKYLS